MDNASKALIMAGAILISIAIVGVGVFIFSSTSSITSSGQQQIDAAAAQTANSTIRQYTGTRVRGSTVREFYEYIQTLNANKTFPNDITVYSGDVTVNASTGAVSGTEMTSTGATSIVANRYFTVNAYDYKPATPDGYYDTVTVEPN